MLSEETQEASTAPNWFVINGNTKPLAIKSTWYFELQHNTTNQTPKLAISLHKNFMKKPCPILILIDNKNQLLTNFILKSHYGLNWGRALKTNAVLSLNWANPNPKNFT